MVNNKVCYLLLWEGMRRTVQIFQMRYPLNLVQSSIFYLLRCPCVGLQKVVPHLQKNILRSVVHVF